ncbi:hypothetical protein MUN78_07075 [Leucobacter allii]|uniref:Uncharacterized protein n=1 Tax=Leucobacter allii TaxID=2932247 RepID=A0ABY4FQK4_9MICO|nr:hypothetical protein [Leucobacter allii]UOQ58579.1 hypothetical protein MUN78_07075 [Leucobacter allii]
MAAETMTKAEETLAEMRDMALRLLTTAPAFVPPAEAASAALLYVQLSHVLWHHPQDPDAEWEGQAAWLAGADQALASMRDRIAELERLRKEWRS